MSPVAVGWEPVGLDGAGRKAVPATATAAAPTTATATAATQLLAPLAALLLAAVATDLVVTRLIVRLAIFIPKGEPWATISAGLGRIGAITDALVPIAGLLVLGVLLIASGHGRRSDRALMAGTSVVAAIGLALVVMPPSAFMTHVADVLIVAVAAGAVATWRPSPGTSALARAGITLLAFALVAAALGRIGATAPVDLGPGGPAIGAWIWWAGQWAFAGGALALGLAGHRDRAYDQVSGQASRNGEAASGHDAAPRSSTAPGRGTAVWPGAVPWRRLAVAAGIAIVYLLLAVRAPAHLGQIAIWAIGVGGMVPIVALAAALGLAIVGIPLVHRLAPNVAVGGSIILFAGYGLSASGLILAGLLGLLIVRSDTTSSTRRSP